MTTVCGPKAKVATFEGGGDDMDLPLKRLSSLDIFLVKQTSCICFFLGGGWRWKQWIGFCKNDCSECFFLDWICICSVYL